MKVLIDAGADVNAEDDVGGEAIIWAGLEGNVDVLKVRSSIPILTLPSHRNDSWTASRCS